MDWTRREVGHNVELGLLKIFTFWLVLRGYDLKFWKNVFTSILLPFRWQSWRCLQDQGFPRAKPPQGSHACTLPWNMWVKGIDRAFFSGRFTRFLGPVLPLQWIFSTGPGSPDEMNKLPRREFLRNWTNSVGTMASSIYVSHLVSSFGSLIVSKESSLSWVLAMWVSCRTLPSA